MENFTSKFEYALRADCVAEGCDPPHTDAGTLHRRKPTQAALDDENLVPTMNGHVCQLLRRTVTYSEWEVIR